MAPEEKGMVIGDAAPEEFVVTGRRPEPEPPPLVFKRDRRVKYLLYVAQVNLHETNHEMTPSERMKPTR